MCNRKSVMDSSLSTQKNVARTKIKRRVIELPYLSAVKHTLTSVCTLMTNTH